MVITVLIIAAIYLVGLFMLAGLIWRAPEGVEDEKGFHAGREKASDDGSL